jgi:hypothetical protein
MNRKINFTMHKLYSLKKSTQGLLTSFVFFMMAVLFAQPLAAQGDSSRPDIRFFSPVSARQGTLIDIVGEHFIGTTSVSFGGTPAASIQVLSDSLIRAKVGTGSSGFVRVTTSFGTDSLGGFTFIRDTIRPKIRSFTPTSGRKGTTVDIVGIQFRNTLSVSFGGVPATAFSVLSDSLIKAVVDNGATGAVRVTTTSGTDSLGGFTFIRDTVRPVIEFFFPTSGKTGTVVEIIGSRFSTTTSVSFGGVPAASFAVIADSIIQAKVGNGATGAVRVTTLFGSDSLKGFTFIRDTLPPDSFPPVIASFTPKAARAGQPVFIFGKHFNGATAVSFGNVPAQSYVVFADTGIRAFVGPGASGAVRVATPFGSDTLGGFIFIRDTLPPDTLRPDITSFTPKFARQGQNVFIFGRNFTGATAVSFGNVPAQSYIVFADTGIRAFVGPGASGAVRVATPFGSDTLGGFIFIRDTLPPDTLRPDIIKFSPTIGTTGTKVFIAGLHFKGVTTVSFGGVPAASFTVLSDSAITAFVDTGATGLVKVGNRFGSDTMGTFIYRPPIIIHDSLTVAPNPAHDFTIVTHPVARFALLRLTDISGNVVKLVKVFPNVSQTRLNLTGVKPGIYKLTWSDGTRSLSVTLLVN